MSYEKLLEEIKFIDDAISHNKTLDNFNDKIKGALVINIIVSLAITLVAGLLFSIFLMIGCMASDWFESLFKDYKNDISFTLLFSIAFSISFISACFFFFKEEVKRKENVKKFTKQKVKISENFSSFNPDKESDFADEFDNYVRQKISAFESDIEKVDLSLKAVKDNDEKFSPYVETIMSITERVTSERARKIGYRIEASRRLCEPEEEQEKLLKIVES